MPLAGTSNSFTSGRAQGQARRRRRSSTSRLRSNPAPEFPEVIPPRLISTSPGNSSAAAWPSRAGTRGIGGGASGRDGEGGRGGRQVRSWWLTLAPG